MVDFDQPHRRFNPLRNSWILVSPHRSQRPWQGQVETPPKETRPEYDSTCYLCPGNQRASGDTNPKYDSTYVFTNDFAAVKPKAAFGPVSGESTDAGKCDEGDDIFRSEQATGTCKVICFSPKHNLTLAELPLDAVETVIHTWASVYREAQDNPEIGYCQIFENKGAAMGCSNPHPHGQTWMTSIIPEEPALEHEALTDYYRKHQKHMLEVYVAKELGVQTDSRVVVEGEHFVALVPFWAVWPFEVMIVSKKLIRNLTELTEAEIKDLAKVTSELTIRYDNLFKTSFPYSMGIHQQFTNACSDETCVEHLHVHFYPPLLRSATVRKFLVGFELLAMPQRDITPEKAAQMLRQVDTVHWTKLERAK